MGALTALATVVLALALLVYAVHVAQHALGMLGLADPVALVAAAVTGVIEFGVGLAIGAAALHVAARLLADTGDVRHATTTALLGFAAFAALAWLPWLGPLLGLAAWFGVLHHRYPGDWLTAGLVGVLAWLLAAATTALLRVANVHLHAVGVPVA